MKPLNPSKPWSPKEFFRASGYYVHNTQGYLAKPESLVFPSRAPPAERTAEDQPFFHVPRHPEEPRTRVDITSGSASLTASQLQDQESMSRKSAAAASTALSIAEYIENYPGMPEGARAAMLLLKLDIISFLNYAWRVLHNKMLLRRSIALDCLERTLPPIDQDQKFALLSQQRPLHLTLHALMRVVVRALEIRRASRNQAAEAGDRAGPRQPPPLQDLANPRIARKL